MLRTNDNLRHSLLHLACLAFVLLIAFTDAFGAIAVLNPEKDNTIFEGQSNSNPPDDFEDNSCGAGNLFSGETDDVFARRALIKFNFAGNVPAGSTISSVILTLEVNRERDGAARTYTIHPITKDWGEGTVNCDELAGGGAGGPADPGDATWLNAKFQQIGWDTVGGGGDFGAATGSTSIANGQSVTATWDSADLGNGGMVTDVQAWVDTPAINHGWIVIGDETAVKSVRRFGSQEGAEPPVLTVEYTPPASTSACCFTNGDCSVLTAGDCTQQGGTSSAEASCVPNMCPQPVGACCNADESCSDTVARDVCETGGGFFQGAGIACSTAQPNCGLEPFVDALPIPPVLAPTGTRPDGVEQYQITVQTAQQQLHSQACTSVNIAEFPGTVGTQETRLC